MRMRTGNDNCDTCWSQVHRSLKGRKRSAAVIQVVLLANVEAVNF